MIGKILLIQKLNLLVLGITKNDEPVAICMRLSKEPKTLDCLHDNSGETWWVALVPVIVKNKAIEQAEEIGEISEDTLKSILADQTLRRNTIQVLFHFYVAEQNISNDLNTYHAFAKAAAEYLD